MPTKYSTKFREAVLNLESPSLGQLLAQTCLRGELPAVHVAEILGVSRMTIHVWFRGAKVSKHKEDAVRTFIELVDADINDKILPKGSYKETLRYIVSFGKPRVPQQTEESAES